MNCEEIKLLLTQYALGDLDEAVTTEVRIHLEKCGSCRASLREIEPTLDLLRDALAAPSAAPKHLSVEQRLLITKKATSHGRKVVRWFISSHPRLLEVAAVFLVCVILAGMLLPVVSSSRGKARRTNSMSNLSQIGRAISMYSMDHEEKLPESFDELKKAGLVVNDKILRDPSTGKEYTYLGRGLNASSPSEVPIAVEKLDGSKNGANVLYNDGSVVWMERKELKEKVLSKITERPAVQGLVQQKAPSAVEDSALYARTYGGSARVISGKAVADMPEKRRTEESVKGEWSGRRQMAGQAGAAAGGGFYSESGKEYAAKSLRGSVAAAPVVPDMPSPTAVTPIHGIGGPVQVAQQAEANEKMVELQVKLPKPTFIGTPTKLKNIDKAEHNRWLVESGRAVESPAVTKDQQAPAGELGLAVKGFSGGTGIGGPPHSAPGQMSDAISENTLSEPSKESSQTDKGVGVGGDMDAPVVPFSVAMTKSPVIMKGLYGNRTKVGKDLALRAYGGGGEGDKKQEEDLKRAEEYAYARARDTKKEEKAVEAKPDLSRQKSAGDLKVDVDKTMPTESATVPERRAATEEDKSGPRFKAYGVNPFVVSKIQPFSTFGIDCDTASYTLARNYMARGYLPPAEAVRTEEFVNFFDYAYKAPDSETFRVYIDCAPSKFGRGLQMMKIGVKGRRLGREEQRQAALTFLVDTSGSMEQPDRIVLVKKSLRMLVEKLNPKDLVSIVKYNSHARIIVERVPASEKQRILDAIDGIECGGSTNLEEGMDRAYQIASRNFVSKGENRVLLMSDGVANLGGMAAKEILQRVEKYRKQGIFCSVFGFGIGTYNDEMLEELANKGDGTYKFIDSEEEARQVFVDDLSANLNTIAKDVKIQVEFNPGRVTRYRQIGYENRQLKKEDFRNDKIDAGEVGSGQSVTALYEMELGGFRIQNSVGKMIYPDREPVATVRVRYQRVDNGQVEEIERVLKAGDIIPQFDRTDARFRLAVCAAQFAEILRGSPFAEGREFQDVSRVLAPVALELNLDGRVQEFKQMVDGANGLSRGQ